MRFQLSTAPKALKVLPVLAAVLALSLQPSAHPAVAATAVGDVVAPTTHTMALPKPDLTVYVTAEYVGKTIGCGYLCAAYTLNVTVGNAGLGGSPPAQLVIVGITDVPSITVPSLQPNWGTGFQRTVVTPAWGNACSTYFIRVDPEDLVAESNETNNITTICLSNHL